MPVKLQQIGLAFSFTLVLFGCAINNSASAPTNPPSTSAQATLEKIKTIVVIYAENRSFDNLYGLFPGADGIRNALKQPATYLQLDRDGKMVLPTLPPVWTSNDPNWSFVGRLPNKPFRIDAPPGGTPSANGIKVSSPDLVHRYYIHQMQLNGGSNNQFAAFSNAGGLTMGYYDGSSMAMWQLAKEYTLADNFFMGAFGGSFLNHFWLVCACTPVMKNPPADRISILDEHTGMPAFKRTSALKAAPQYTGDLTFTPADKTTSLSYAVNAVQPPFQPSGTKPAEHGDPALADPDATGEAFVLEPQTAKTIGDTLSDKQIDWAWYAGAWHAAVADGMQSPSQPRKVIYNSSAGSPNFQVHHQPFNYFSRFDPATLKGREQRAAHLKDYTDLQIDIAKGSLPPVVFYKPQGTLNQHPGYTDVMSGDAHIAEVVRQLQAGPQWPGMFIIVTYDENGGLWDHVPPPKADRWGPGSRIPAILISPLVKKHTIDHTLYDTTSIIKFITRRFGLDPLPGVRKNMGDFTSNLE
ncbi:acid phosphatase [Methylomicrobium sp. Wu6]|uniref:acid phosphatase n=1 Tax=Methylomicrobium sp. Wu6 TaxID=3107928 RepID=UPI002DD648B7|nr:acid phosphatase [Methylomicrobium sp. Wu6]MEC4748497.1 acid phosphatase [Methylomicrobium sp. Wu6]